MVNPVMPHIRKPMPKRRGNSFYRDKTDYSKYAVSLCGAPITDRDTDYRYAGTKKFQKYAAEYCQECCRLRAHEATNG